MLPCRDIDATFVEMGVGGIEIFNKIVEKNSSDKRQSEFLKRKEKDMDENCYL